MSIDETLRVRMGELERRLKKLPEEIQAWTKRANAQQLDMRAHHSQIRAIQQLMAAYQQRQHYLFGKLQNDPVTFGERSQQLVETIIQSRRVWDFFREKLDLRFSEDFKDALWIADTVAWDCHRPVLETAATLELLDSSKFREPPLTYLSADFAPTTWVRSSRPREGQTYHLGNDTLPIPVIAVPSDHLSNLWELLTIAHETAHDLEADLGIRTELETSLGRELTAQNRTERLSTWKNWKGEVFADLLALELVGPSYTDALMHILLLPKKSLGEEPGSKHPAPYIRIPMNVAYIRQMLPDSPAIKAHAERIEKRWKAFCDDAPAEFVGDFAAVFKSLMDAGLPALQENSVRTLVQYTLAEDEKIRDAAQWLIGAPVNQPKAMRQRHAIAAARMAVDAAAQEADLAGSLAHINERTTKLVRDLDPGGQRASSNTTAHQKFIESYMDRIHT